jgi:hypothetical protein
MGNNSSFSLVESSGVGSPARVSCSSCAHFQPDTINPPQGMGRCTRTLSGLPPKGGSGYGVCYPFSLRVCKHYEPIEE